jgi:hypothetical protein
MNEPGETELDDLLAPATVDCYSEDEELAGLATMTGRSAAAASSRAGPSPAAAMVISSFELTTRPWAGLRGTETDPPAVMGPAEATA